MRRDLGDGFEVDDDPARINVATVHGFLSEQAYWAIGRPYELQERLIREATRVVGVYKDGAQIGFARAVSDDNSFVYLADVYVDPAHRGKSLGVELVREMIENGPLTQRRWLLHTSDAHDLYRKFGFAEPDFKLMERPVLLPPGGDAGSAS